MVLETLPVVILIISTALSLTYRKYYIALIRRLHCTEMFNKPWMNN